MTLISTKNFQLKKKIKDRRDQLREAYDLAELPDRDRDIDHAAIDYTVDDLLAKGWQDVDVIEYTCCLEHVNLFLAESYALSKMEELKKKYGS